MRALLYSSLAVATAVTLPLAGPAWPSSGHADCSSLRVYPAPAVPQAGTLMQVFIAGHNRAVALPQATVADEPLHWRAAGDSLVAVAAVPIDSATGVSLRLRCQDSSEQVVRIPTAAGRYRLEALRVAPRFSAHPDSALNERMRREAERAAVVSRMAHDTPRLWTAPFLAPRPSRITSAFGSGRTFNGTVTSRHMGTDYAGVTGAPVRATNRGVVRLVDAFHLGGNVVYLDHGEGLVTAYLHLSRQQVSVGDTVQRGQIIGNVGATGRVTGAHLHFITRYGAVTVNPESVLALRDTEGERQERQERQ